MIPNNVPKRPSGITPFHQWCKEVHDRLFKRLVFRNSSTVTWTQTENGISAQASAGGGSGTTVQLCVITELFGGVEDQAFDYFGATPWNSQSNSLQGSQIIVAKCVTARGPFSELIDQNVIQYSEYNNDATRFAANLTTQAVEFDSIHPRYVPYPGTPPDLDDNGNPLPYDSGLTINQCFVFVARTVNPTGVLDANGNQIFLLEDQPNRYWSYSPSLNGG